MEGAAEQGATGPAGEQQAAAASAARDAAGAAPVGFAKRKNRGNIRKRAADEEEGASGGGGDDGGVVRKAAKQKEGSMAFTTKRTDRAEVFAFESSNTVQQRQDDATRTNEQETAHDRDARWVAGWHLLNAQTSSTSPGAAMCIDPVLQRVLCSACWHLPTPVPLCAHSLHTHTVPHPAGRCASRCWRRRTALWRCLAATTACTAA